MEDIKGSALNKLKSRVRETVSFLPVFLKAPVTQIQRAPNWDVWNAELGRLERPDSFDYRVDSFRSPRRAGRAQFHERSFRNFSSSVAHCSFYRIAFRGFLLRFHDSFPKPDGFSESFCHRRFGVDSSFAHTDFRADRSSPFDSWSHRVGTSFDRRFRRQSRIAETKSH